MSDEIYKRQREHIAKSASAAEKLTEVGMRVIVTRDDASLLVTMLDSLPWQLGHGQWVAKVDGIRGGYDCARIQPWTKAAVGL